MMRLRTRAAREAAVILGRSAVEQALADRQGVAEYLLAHPAAVLEAVHGIRAHLPNEVAAAVTFAATLEPAVRVAVAGAWADRGTARVLAGVGLEESP